MSFSLDHIVIAVANLDEAVADYRALGFTVYPGGEHHGGASHNALVIFADGSYFEIIAYRRRAPENRWWAVLDGAGEGFVDFAISPENMQRELDAARLRGLAVSDATPGGRLRPDGARLDWMSARSQTNDLPFWCSDVTPRALRVPEGPMRKHANGAQGVGRILVTVKDAAVSAARYIALLGADAVSARDGGAQVKMGDLSIELIAPRDEAERRRLAARGEGPVAVTLRGERAATLDPRRTHGADLVIAEGKLL